MAQTSFNGDSQHWPSLLAARRNPGMKPVPAKSRQQPQQQNQGALFKENHCQHQPNQDAACNESYKPPATLATLGPPPGLEDEIAVKFTAIAATDCGSDCSTEPGSTESIALDDKPQNHNQSRQLPAWLMPQASISSVHSTPRTALREKGAEALAELSSAEMSRRSVGQTSLDRLRASGQEVLKGMAKNRHSYMAATSSVFEAHHPQHYFSQPPCFWGIPPGSLEALAQQQMSFCAPQFFAPTLPESEEPLLHAQPPNVYEPQRILLSQHVAGTESEAGGAYSKKSTADQTFTPEPRSPLKVDVTMLSINNECAL